MDDARCLAGGGARVAMSDKIRMKERERREGGDQETESRRERGG